MNFSTIEIGIMLVSFMTVMGVICYLIAARKSQSPLKASALGFIFSVIPVLGIVYAIYLVGQEDQNTDIN